MINDNKLTLSNNIALFQENNICVIIISIKSMGEKMEKGLFITFEGIDGSGKSTQLELLEEDLNKAKIDFLIIREPGGTLISEQIRQILLDGKNQEMTPETELLLFEAARAQLVDQVVFPALNEGKVVISDRFFDSTTAYQGFGRNKDVEFIQKLNTFATKDLMPDLTFYFDISLNTALKRLNARKHKSDRLDVEGENFLEKTRQGYLQIAASDKNRVKIINAEQTVDEVYKELKAYLIQAIELGGNI